MAKPYPLIIHQGQSLEKPFRRVFSTGDDIGEVIDFPDFGITNARLQIRDDYVAMDGQLILTLTTDDGSIVLGTYTDTAGKTWSGYIQASAAATSELTAWNHALYDLILYNDAQTWVRSIFSGPAILIPAIINMGDE